MSIQNIKNAAKFMAQQGFQVFPKYEGRLPHNFLHNRGETRGFIESVYHSPSTTEQRLIDEWPDEVYGRELTGYGVHPFKRAIIIDVDVKGDKKGLQSLYTLAEKYNLDLDTFVVQSPSGGFHYYFEYPEHLKSDAAVYISSPVEFSLPEGENHVRYSGLDVRSDSAHVTGPLGAKQFYKGQDANSSNLIKDGLYTVKSGHVNKLKPLPLDLVKFWIKHVNKESVQVSANEVPVGIRNDYIFKQIICRYKAKNLPLWQAHAAIKEIYPSMEQGRDPVSLESFLDRATQIYNDDSYNANSYQVILDEYLNNLIFIAASNEVYDLRTGMAIPKANADIFYKNLTMIENKETGKISAVDVFKKWLESPARMDVSMKSYLPGQPQICETSEVTGLPIRVLNTYVSPKAIYADVLNSKEFQENYSTDHIYIKSFLELTDYVCGDKASYFLQFAAHLVQQPHRKVQHMLMIASETQGIGKDTWFKCVTAAIGDRNAKVIELAGFEDKFNAHLFESQLILINEGDTRYSKERNGVYNKLKVHLTADKLERRGMRQDYVTQKLFSNYMWFANNVDAIGIDDGDSRIYPHISNQEMVLPKPLAKIIYSSLESKDFGAFLYKFLNEYEITDFEYFGRAPETEDKQRLIIENMDICKRNAIESIKYGDEFFTQGIFSKDLVTMWYSRNFSARSPQVVDRAVAAIIRYAVKDLNVVKKRIRAPRFTTSYGSQPFQITSSDRTVDVYISKNLERSGAGTKELVILMKKAIIEMAPIEAAIVEQEFKKISL